MHTQGTAVLDRPAEGTVPPEALLPALGVGAWARDLEPASSRNNPARELATRPDVHDLTYTELAIALNASGIHPQRFRSAEPVQLMAWAAQGLALLGIDRVRRYDRRTRHLNILVLDHCASAHDQAEYTRMWPHGSKAVQSCHDAAYRVYFASTAGPASHTNPYPLHAPLSALHG
jgi:hypothetical protein